MATLKYIETRSDAAGKSLAKITCVISLSNLLESNLCSNQIVPEKLLISKGPQPSADVPAVLQAESIPVRLRYRHQAETEDGASLRSCILLPTFFRAILRKET